MPGCPLCLIFPRFKTYNQIDTMMWDVRGNGSPSDGPRPPTPRFPVPCPGAPPDMRYPLTGFPCQRLKFTDSQHRSPYPTPFMPLGASDVPPLRVHGSNPYPTYNTFPRSFAPHFEGAQARMPSPIPTYTVQFPKSSRQPYYGHESPHGHIHHRTRTKSNETRRVHYADEKSRSHGAHQTIHVSTARHDRVESSQQLRAIQTRQPNDGHRHRANSAGSALPRPVILQPEPVSQPQHSRRFEYSKCTGRKKALLIGINYIGQKRELRGCINDITNVKHFLTTQWGYREGDIVMLRDDTRNPRQMPTRRNLIDAMRWLVKDAKSHDSLFFHYSGHGGQIPDTDGDETDGLDEGRKNIPPV
ncbi:caspase domain-containing protein [Scleroderma citrinum]